MSLSRPRLDDLVQIALDAGREVMAVCDAGFEAIEKADGSPVTVADQRAEAVIELGLARAAPGIAMIGEEAASEGRVPDIADHFFCVDPIDGTRDFVEGKTGEFTVNIALIEYGAPVMGVVLAPVLGVLYAGEDNRAYKARADARAAKLIEPLAPIAAKRAGAWRVIASRRSGKNSATDKFAEALGQHERISMSSSIKFCLLAEGAADIYPRFGEVSEWDAAAGHAVLAAAGGGVMRHDGAPLKYGNASDKFLVKGLIAFSDPSAREAALAAMQKLPKR